MGLPTFLSMHCQPQFRFNEKMAGSAWTEFCGVCEPPPPPPPPRIPSSPGKGVGERLGAWLGCEGARAGRSGGARCPCRAGCPAGGRRRGRRRRPGCGPPCTAAPAGAPPPPGPAPPPPATLAREKRARAPNMVPTPGSQQHGGAVRCIQPMHHGHLLTLSATPVILFGAPRGSSIQPVCQAGALSVRQHVVNTPGWSHKSTAGSGPTPAGSTRAYSGCSGERPRLAQVGSSLRPGAAAQH